MEMEKEAKKLQDDLAFTDMLMSPSRGGDFVEMAIKKLQRLTIRMEANHHARAHVHIDYGRERHVASFAVDNGERMAGRMPAKYDRDVKKWIIQHQVKLKSLWDAMKRGEPHELILAELKAAKYVVAVKGQVLACPSERSEPFEQTSIHLLTARNRQMTNYQSTPKP
ncbi:DUF4160 domain-containing protein [Pseudomonas cichorii]|uniref:DUF4160 domain-containing protein n=1 Tax=Pseudomonas cichorii TaxID=36746 RepID=UPI001C88FCFB|nr:DUF4160 domain-containing protein [Pseudomonas cichorii]MBX8515468.1 DUF4160 domain-containing protein [Pseudomonas cichorii]